MEYYTEQQMIDYAEKWYQYGRIITEADIGYVGYPKTKPALPQAHIIKSVCKCCDGLRKIEEITFTGCIVCGNPI